MPTATTRTARRASRLGAVCHHGAMPRPRPTSPLGLAFTAFHLWRRLPPAQRKQMLRLARVHGPKVAAAALARRRRAREQSQSR
jgi:hypothetical protein